MICKLIKIRSGHYRRVYVDDPQITRLLRNSNIHKGSFCPLLNVCNIITLHGDVSHENGLTPRKQKSQKQKSKYSGQKKKCEIPSKKKNCFDNNYCTLSNEALDNFSRNNIDTKYHDDEAGKHSVIEILNNNSSYSLKPSRQSIHNESPQNSDTHLNVPEDDILLYLRKTNTSSFDEDESQKIENEDFNSDFDPRSDNSNKNVTQIQSKGDLVRGISVRAILPDLGLKPLTIRFDANLKCVILTRMRKTTFLLGQNILSVHTIVEDFKLLKELSMLNEEQLIDIDNSVAIVTTVLCSPLVLKFSEKNLKDDFVFNCLKIAPDIAPYFNKNTNVYVPHERDKLIEILIEAGYLERSKDSPNSIELTKKFNFYPDVPLVRHS